MIVGVLVMIMTICIVVGFKQTVTDKVAGFGAHIQVVSFDNNNTYDLHPIEVSDSLLARLAGYAHVVSAAPYITKPGMLKTDGAFQGIVLKGTDYWDFFVRALVEGEQPANANEIIVSRVAAQKMKLAVGDAVTAYFVDDNSNNLLPCKAYPQIVPLLAGWGNIAIDETGLTCEQVINRISG
jgi:lipoprotein-releasing system permease protein